MKKIQHTFTIIGFDVESSFTSLSEQKAKRVTFDTLRRCLVEMNFKTENLPTTEGFLKWSDRQVDEFLGDHLQLSAYIKHDKLELPC